VSSRKEEKATKKGGLNFTEAVKMLVKAFRNPAVVAQESSQRGPEPIVCRDVIYHGAGRAEKGPHPPGRVLSTHP